MAVNSSCGVGGEFAWTTDKAHTVAESSVKQIVGNRVLRCHSYEDELKVVEVELF